MDENETRTNLERLYRAMDAVDDAVDAATAAATGLINSPCCSCRCMGQTACDYCKFKAAYHKLREAEAVLNKAQEIIDKEEAAEAAN